MRTRPVLRRQRETCGEQEEGLATDPAADGDDLVGDTRQRSYALQPLKASHYSSSSLVWS
jgi:hypothetical protein